MTTYHGNRWMLRRDHNSVLQIETESFADPWDSSELVAHLMRSDTIGLVSEHHEMIRGYVVYSLSPKVYRIQRLAVGTLWRRQGVAGQMLARLEDKLQEIARRTAIEIDVPERNLPMQLLLRSRGYVATEVIDDSLGDASYRFRFSAEVLV